MLERPLQNGFEYLGSLDPNKQSYFFNWLPITTQPSFLDQQFSKPFLGGKGGLPPPSPILLQPPQKWRET